MRQELQGELFDKYSDLFINRHKSRYESCLARGIECDDGWYSIISSICWIINQHESNIKNLCEMRLIADPNHESGYENVRFDQIKEKFGGLRVYYSGGDEYIHGVVRMAEEMSYKTCEMCGNMASLKKSVGFVKTLCDKCI